MLKVLTQCPVCDGKLQSVRLMCKSCGTVIENQFDFPKLMHLSKEQMEFVEVFIKSRGNIKDVEKELGISYPTVRAKLDQVIDLISDKKNSVDKEKRLLDAGYQNDILKKLEEGILSPEEAISKLKEE